MSRRTRGVVLRIDQFAAANAVLTRRRSSCAVNGLERRLKCWTVVAVRTHAVEQMIRVSGYDFLTRWISSRPFIFGMTMSVISKWIGSLTCSRF